MNKNAVSKAKPIVKRNEQLKIIKTVEILEDKNNKMLCDQIKNMNESHKKKLKNCKNDNFNIFDQ